MWVRLSWRTIRFAAIGGVLGATFGASTGWALFGDAVNGAAALAVGGAAVGGWVEVFGSRATGRTLPLVVVAVLLSACSLYEHVEFHNDGQSKQAFQRDDYECERDADLRSREPMTAGGYGVLAQSADRFSGKMQREGRRREIYMSCMQARGYRPKT